MFWVIRKIISICFILCTQRLPLSPLDFIQVRCLHERTSVSSFQYRVTLPPEVMAGTGKICSLF